MAVYGCSGLGIDLGLGDCVRIRLTLWLVCCWFGFLWLVFVCCLYVVGVLLSYLI